MESEVLTFDFFGEQTRVVMKDNEPWFFATDVAGILGYRNAPDMTRTLDEDEVVSTQIVRRNGEHGNPNITVISLSGLFAAVLKSREEWREHKKEITAEIRRRREGVFGKGAEGLGKFLGSFGLNIKPADMNDPAVQEYFRKFDEEHPD